MGHSITSALLTVTPWWTRYGKDKALVQPLARLQSQMLLSGRYFRRKSVGVKIHHCKTWVSKVQTEVSPGPAVVQLVWPWIKAEHLHVEVESSAKISAETSPFSGGLAHLHKLVAVTASFVPPSVHPFKFLGGENIPSVLSWLDDQGLHVLKHMLQCFGRGEAAWV